MHSVGIEYFLGVLVLWAGLIAHNWYMNEVKDDVPADVYKDKLNKVNLWLALKPSTVVMGLTLVLAFVLAAGTLSVPVVGPYLAMALGLACFGDLLVVIKTLRAPKA